MHGLQAKPGRHLLTYGLVDGILIVGIKTMIEETVAKLRKSFSIKEVQNLNDYLGVKIIRSKDCCKEWLGQPTILLSLGEMFGADVVKLRTTHTPGPLDM